MAKAFFYYFIYANKFATLIINKALSADAEKAFSFVGVAGLFFYIIIL
jgi:hypothetical protein